VSAVSDRHEAARHDRRAGNPRQSAEKPGRLVAVVALCGGAGASTLVYLLCCAAIAEGERPVLCVDATGRAGIAAHAGVRGALSFAHASIELQAGRTPEPVRLFATSKDRVRVLSQAPSLAQPLLALDGANRLLADARAAHALTVIDCGTLNSDHERLALASADHLLLVMPASRPGLERAAPLAAQARELCPDASVALIARLEQRERKAPVSELAPIAEAIGARLVLCPHLEDLRERPIERTLERAQITFEALRGVLAR
jgi:MinD-like ATPase involved in chromosome partitioning or flagellar assembly